MATVFANSALMMGPLALSAGTQPILQAEEASRLAVTSLLMMVNPAAAVSLNAFHEMTRSGAASHPLFRPANDNGIAESQDADELISIGDQSKTDGDYATAIRAYEKALHLDPENSEILFDLAQADFGNGDFSSAARGLSAYLSKPGNSRFDEARKLRLEANENDLKRIEDGQIELGESHDIEIERVRAEINTDEAMLLALNADSISANIETRRFAPSEQLAAQFAAFSAVSFEEAEDADFVQDRLSHLTAATYGALETDASASDRPEVRERAPLYKAQKALALGEIDEATEILEPLQEKFPEAAALRDHTLFAAACQRLSDEKTDEAVEILTPLRDRLPAADRLLTRLGHVSPRVVNLQALAVWENYIEDRKAVEIDGDTSLLGMAFGGIQYAVEGKTGHERIYAKWELETDLLDEVRKRLTARQNDTIDGALAAIAADGPEALRSRADALRKEPHSTDGSSLLGQMVRHLADGGKNEEGARFLIEQAEQHALHFQGHRTAFALCGLMRDAAGDNLGLREAALDRIGNLQGSKSFSKIAWDAVQTEDPLSIGVELLVLKGATRVGALARLAVGEKIALTGRKAVVLGMAAEVGAEGTTLWAANTTQEAASQDVGRVLTPLHLAKGLGASLLMVPNIKGFQALGKFSAITLETGAALTWVLTHGWSLGGMVLSTQTSQRLGLTETPEGGLKESLVHDLIGYAKFAVAPRAVDHALGAKHVQATRDLQAKIERTESTLRIAPPKPPAELPAFAEANSHAYGVAGPAGVYGLLTSQGLPQSVALLGGAMAFAPFAVGMIWGKVMLPGASKRAAAPAAPEPISFLARQARPVQEVSPVEAVAKVENITAKLPQAVSEKLVEKSAEDPEIAVLREDLLKTMTLQLSHSGSLASSLESPSLRRTLDALSTKNPALRADIAAFSEQAKVCRERIADHENAARVALESGDLFEISQAAVRWDAKVAPEIDKLKESNYYLLHAAYDAAVDRAVAAAGKQEFELTRLKVEANVKGLSMDFRIEVKNLEDLPLDPQNPVGSLETWSARDLVTIEVTADNPGHLAEIQKTLSRAASAEEPIDVRFDVESETAPALAKRRTNVLTHPLLAPMWSFLGMGMGGGWSGTGSNTAQVLQGRTDGKFLTIGRLPGNDIVVSNAMVSGQHGAIGWGRSVKDGKTVEGWVVVDGPVGSPQRSRNGLFVNGQRVPGKFHPVAHGDRIRIGEEEFTFEDPRLPSMNALASVAKADAVIGHNVSHLLSSRFMHVLKNEKVVMRKFTEESSASGYVHVNTLIDAQGQIVYLGKLKDFTPEIRKGYEAGIYEVVSLFVDLQGVIHTDQSPGFSSLPEPSRNALLRAIEVANTKRQTGR